MVDEALSRNRFSIGDWIVRPTDGVVERGKERCHLRPKAMDFLLLLAESPGQTVGKDIILARLWPDAVVEEGALSRCVSELRSTLGDSPKRPRYIQTRHRRGYRLIASVGPAEAVETAESAAMEAVGQPRATPAKAIAFVLISALALTVSGAFLRPASRHETQPVAVSSSGSPASPRAVVLTPIQLAEDDANRWIGRAVAHLLTAELAATTRLRLVPADVSGRSESALAIADGASWAPDSLARLRTRFGVDLVIDGHYVLSEGGEDDLRLDLMATDAASGEIRAAAVEHGPSERLGEIVTLAAMRLREELGATLETKDGRPVLTVEAGASALPQAYFQGLLLLERLEARRARDRLEEAIAAAPERPWPRLALAESWSRLGYDRNAASAVAEALDRAQELEGEERLWFDARARVLATQWGGAIERFRALVLLRPANLEYRLSLLSALVESGRMADALELVEATHQEHPETTEDPRLAMLAGEVALAMGERERAVASARAAFGASRALAAPAIEARARFLEARALYEDGRVDEADAALEVARQRFVLARDRAGEAGALVNLSAWLGRRGEHGRASEAAEAALAISREIGDRSGEARALRVLSLRVWQRDGQAAGRQMLEQALAISREIGDRSGEAEGLVNVAIAHARFVRVTSIMPFFEQALAIQRELGDRQGIAKTLSNIGRAALLGGDLDAASAAYEEAAGLMAELDPKSRGLIAFNLGYLRQVKGESAAARRDFLLATEIFRQISHATMSDASLEALGSAALMSDDLPAAFLYFRACLRARQLRREPNRVVRAKVVLSRALVASGRHAEALRWAREAYEEAQAAKAVGVRASAVEALAVALLEAGRPDDAEPVISQLAEGDPDRRSWPTINRAIHDLSRARIEGAAGDIAAAVELATALRAYFERSGAASLVLDADYVLLELERRERGRVDADRAAALEAAARERGLNLLARRVATLAAV